MARPRATDYDDKRAAILREAAVLFATRGFDRTSMSEIAQALGVSKALFYHYYRSKDALLFDIIRNHLLELVEAAEGADDAAQRPEARLHAVVVAIFECYRDADAQHKIQINHLGQLQPEQQGELKGFERRLVDVISGIVGAINPGLPRDFIRPVTMSIFGTLNWKYMWFRENGRVSHEDYAALVTRMFVAAIRAETAAVPARAAG
ncbi:MAG: TetR/AcrR family transcriptional [Beijerinckiaceae bacterium]|nr:MAG: TetR/AcrR family transcriptional [Beijerinckiaceae bacterium]